MDVTIENEYLSVTVDTLGGGLKRVFDKKRQDRINYAGDDERAWKSRDVIIFPFIARLKDKIYTHNGKQYSMESHGLLRYAQFTVEYKTNTKAVLKVCSDTETLKRYPFEFCFRVGYEVKDNKLITSLEAENTGKGEMPFMLGAHPAYLLDKTEREDMTDTSGNYLIFDNPSPLKVRTLDDAGEFITGETQFPFNKEIELNKQLFGKYKTIMLEGVKGSVTLKRRSRSLRFELGEPPLFAVWSHPKYGGYVCIEPWCGQPDSAQPEREFSLKPYMNKIGANQKYVYTYSLEVL